MGASAGEALVTADWLARHRHHPGVRIIDGSFHLPASGRDPRTEYARRHIPGAVFFDIDGICDPASDLPHMLPDGAAFAAAVGALGIGNHHHVVVYNTAGGAGAERVWWTFRVFGHDAVSVLDGGLDAWLAAGGPTDDRPVRLPAEAFVARFRPALVAGAEAVLAALRTGGAQIVDNRSSGRFRGTEPEPRPVKRLGHIPGSVNIPFGSYFDPERGGRWRTCGALREIFASAGVEPCRPIIAACGSGVTAAATAFAAFLLGNAEAAVYDGSWAEWGNRDDTPIER